MTCSQEAEKIICCSIATLREVPETGFAPTPFAGVTSEKASSTARGADAFDIFGLFSSHREVQSGEKLESQVDSQIKIDRQQINFVGTGMNLLGSRHQH